jgi:hypothetical protein
VPRCPIAVAACRSEFPQPIAPSPDRLVACPVTMEKERSYGAAVGI